jgi:hypothetical protein
MERQPIPPVVLDYGVASSTEVGLCRSIAPILIFSGISILAGMTSFIWALKALRRFQTFEGRRILTNSAREAHYSMWGGGVQFWLNTLIQVAIGIIVLELVGRKRWKSTSLSLVGLCALVWILVSFALFELNLEAFP